MSSTEAEYIGMFEASKIIMWMRQLLTKLGHLSNNSTVLYEDNKSAIHIVQNLVANKTIHVDYRPTETMTDIIKRLDSNFFLAHPRFLLGHLV